MREAEMADLKKQFDETTSGLQSAVSGMASSLDPTGIKSDLEKMINEPAKDPTQLDSSVATSTPATPPSDPAAPLATPATATPEATPPSDPVALGTAPAAPAQTLDLPLPEMPAPLEAKDFADAAPATPAPAPKPEGDKAA